MAENYKIVNSIQLNSELTNIANSIRVKSGTVGELNFYNHDFDLKVSSIQTPADGSIPTVIHTEPTIVGTFNTTTGNVEMQAGHHADAGYMGLSGTLYNTANVQIGLATKSTSSVTNSANSVTGWVNVTAGYTPGFNQQVSGNIPAVTFDNANKISGASFVETTGDYGFRASVQIPSGYYAGGTYTKDFSTGIFPAPESKGTADKMLAGYSLYDQDGKLITGTMPNQGAQSSTLTYATNSYTIPAGYHTGAGIINVPKATRATPSVNSVTFNASNNIISIDANVVQTAGVVNAGTLTGSATRNVYDLVGTGASTISGTIYTGKPGLSVANSTGIVTASVASADTSLTPSVTAGYITSGTAGSVTAKSNSNTLQLNIKAGGTTTITSNTKIINAGQFATGDIYATVTSGAISAADSSITGGSFTPTLTYNSSSGKFDYGGSKSVSGNAYANVSTAGYVTSAKNTSKSLSATVSATGNIAKVGTGVTITGDTTKAPTLARTAKPSGDTWTDAANGAATTTKPTSGVYVQIDAAANTGTLTATPKVTSAGYGTTTSGQYSATAGTATVGAAKATTAYVPITSGSATTPATTKAQSTPSISIDSAGKITASVAATSVSVTPTVSAGWVASGTAGTVTMSESSNTKQLTTQAAKTVTPSSSSQTAVASGVYTTGAITVAAVPTETKTATANGTVTPTSGKYLTSVTVAIPTYDGSVS